MSVSWNLIKPVGRISSSNLAAVLVPGATAFAARALVGGLAPAPAGTPGVRGGKVTGGGKAGKERAGVDGVTPGPGAGVAVMVGALVGFAAESAVAGALVAWEVTTGGTRASLVPAGGVLVLTAGALVAFLAPSAGAGAAPGGAGWAASQA